MDEPAEKESKKRFADVSDRDFQRILKDKDSKHTQQATARAVKLFKRYLSEKGFDTDFEIHPPSELDSILQKFYSEARTEDGEYYKKSSLMSIRYGLNRYMNDVRGIDIMKDREFKDSNKAFSAMVVELKREGYGGVDHFPPIEDTDLQKMYSGFDLNDPVSLQHKVFVDIMLYFGRRGRENLRDLTVMDFALATDDQKLRYIYLKKDEKTKNHQTDTNTAKGRMYEIRDNDELCPVRSFLKYKSKLNCNSCRFFQRPSKKPKDNVWYDACPIGHNVLGNMMATISVNHKLSVKYTNHSLRATAVHLLDAAQFPGRHIMTITGHKSETSLRTYTGFTDSNTKRQMSDVISKRLRPDFTNYGDSTGRSSVNRHTNASVSGVNYSADASVKTVNFSTNAALSSASNNEIVDFNSFDLTPLSSSQMDNLLEDFQNDDFDEVLRTLPDDNVQVVAPKLSFDISSNATLPSNLFPRNFFPNIQNCGTVNINYNIFPK